jgi:uncharacterized coiled-coil protein SlyX
MLLRTLFLLFVLGLGVQAQTAATLEAQIAALSARITAQQATIQSLQKQITLVQSNETTQASSIAALSKSFVPIQSAVAATQGVDTSQASAIAQLQFTMNKIVQNPVLGLAPFVTVDWNPEVGMVGPHVIFHGCNVHFVSGSGTTNDNGNPTGLGNVVIGYDEDPASSTIVSPYSSTGASNPLYPGDRVGSHNLIVGRWHRWLRLAFGSIVAGENNTLDNEGASVLGGAYNIAEAPLSVVVSGVYNATMNSESVIVGGTINQTSGYQSVVLGGSFNETYGPDGVILGGQENILYGSGGVMLGGYQQRILINADEVYPDPAHWQPVQSATSGF